MGQDQPGADARDLREIVATEDQALFDLDRTAGIPVEHLDTPVRGWQAVFGQDLDSRPGPSPGTRPTKGEQRLPELRDASLRF